MIIRFAHVKFKGYETILPWFVILQTMDWLVGHQNIVWDEAILSEGTLMFYDDMGKIFFNLLSRTIENFYTRRHKDL